MGPPPADNTRRQCLPHNVESQPGQAAGWTMHGRDGVTRALYGAARGRRVAIVRAFVKKTQKTPGREIDWAIRPRKEVEP